MAKKSKTHRKTIDQVFVLLGAVSVVVLATISILLWYGQKFIINQVSTELSSQHIKFPDKGSPALDPAQYPGLQQYAGQTVDTGPKAKAYANEFIGHHLDAVAGGKTYSEVSNEAKKNPDDKKLQTQKQTLFQGEVLRGTLLNAYAFWTIGVLAKYMAIATSIGTIIMAFLVYFGIRRLK